ncbi:MAG TPA: SpoIIE family protein phosphatase [Thermoanaerobaculia bacterium]|jgi:serine phosphatase RsbU (regulator of sigma subunit)|nr:SpoIIE family protein phosphatase [Thermoanaerobaculia bacterium]
MPHFRDLSIRSKLMTGFMLTSLAALLLTVAALAVYDRSTFRDEVLRDVNTLAGIIGENASSSVAFNDRQTAQATLAALRAQPQITGAAIYDSKGVLFATYARASNGDKAGPLPHDGSWIDAQHIGVVRPVLFNDARVGTVTVRSDLSELAVRRARTLQIAGGIYVGAAFLALLLASIFQRAITRPIHRLLEAEKRVSREKDYTLRVEKKANDEIGLLIDGFNEMLSEIRSRDAEILAKHDQEMALARSIQTSVLPRTFELPGYDISAIMLPAEEVGGDFYEFRRSDDGRGGAWIGIGDVTGHGVTSGLIMMMAQSMFTMLCEQNGHDQSPARFVSLLNRAMFYNLKSRLGQEKFMTMVVARVEEDGRLVYAGAHTDLLIYRAANRTVDRLPTDGLWLGIADDVEHLTSDRTITLHRGDVALLHTDGVTEARNVSGECYDIGRMTEELRRLHDKPAVTIVTTIAAAAWQWAGTPKDDVSLMAVKRS